MAKGAPKRSDYPKGFIGQAKYEAALKRYKASMGPPAPKPAKPEGSVNRRGRFVPAKPKPKPTPAKPTPAKPTPAKPAATKPTPAKAKPTPAKPAAAKPKPKPAPARSSTYSQAAMMKDIRAADSAAARSKELKKLQELREEAKKKSLEQAKKNRARGNSRPRGPRG